MVFEAQRNFGFFLTPKVKNKTNHSVDVIDSNNDGPVDEGSISWALSTKKRAPLLRQD
jgi:hypothetical protein